MKKVFKNNFWILIHFFALFAFVIIRACILPIIPDEAFSYFFYVEPKTIFSHDTQIDANNHYLNSILSIFSVKTFGLSKLAFRLPNVLSFVFYYFYAYKIASFSKNLGLKWIGLIALTSIYPILEFFSLSRGYGISFALLLAMIFHSMAYFDDHKKYRIWLSLFLAVLMLSAQLSLLFAAAGLLFLNLVKFVENNWRNSKIDICVVALLKVAVLLFFIVHIKGLQDGGFLYFGISEGFPIENIIYLNKLVFNWSNSLLSYIIFVLFCVALIYPVFLLILRKTTCLQEKQLAFSIALQASLIGILIAVYVLNGAGPLARTALYLYLLLIGTLLVMANSFTKIRAIISVLLLVFSVLSMHQLNTNQVNYWTSHRIDKKAYEELKKHHEGLEIIGSSMYIDRSIEMELNHLQNSGHTIHIIEESISQMNYVFLTPTDCDRYKNELANFICLYDGCNGVSLFQKKIGLTKSSVVENFSINEVNENQEFIGISTIFFDDKYLNTKKYVLYGHLEVHKAKKTASMNITLQFFDETGASIHHRYYPINRISAFFNHQKSTAFKIPIAEIPALAHEMRIYLYNPKKILINTIAITGELRSF